jgi:hypothetical protein
MFKYILIAIVAAAWYVVVVYGPDITNEMIGKMFVFGIFGCLLVFSIFKFGVHYKIHSINRFVMSFYYAVFEYRKSQHHPSGMSYVNSVRDQADVALAANFDPTLTTADLKIPGTLYAGKDPVLDNLRARIKEAERIKLEARQLDGKANVMLGKAKELLVENELDEKKPASRLDAMFDIEKGVAHIVDLTVDEIKDQTYGQTPDFEIITRIALDNNPYFSRTYKYFDSEDVSAVLHRSPFMIILVGIIGTFAGFYLALGAGGDLKSGAAVAIVSSLVALPVSLVMDYINTLFPDKSRYQQAFDKYKVSLEMLFNHERELDNIRRDRRRAKGPDPVPSSEFDEPGETGTGEESSETDTSEWSSETDTDEWSGETSAR